MELRQLRYFLAVAEEGLITKAAQRLHMTQSPLSQQMILLEKELGLQLFQRSKKKLTLTKGGEILKHRAEQILELLQSTQREVTETAQGLQGVLTIGLIHSSGRLLLPEVIQSFHKTYPKITFDLKQGDTVHILELLHAHLVDLAFIRLPIPIKEYDFLPIPQEGLVLAANPEFFPLPDQELSLENLIDFPLLLHRRYQPLLFDAIQEKNVSPNVLCTSDELIPLLTWAIQGLGIAIVPEFAANFLSPQTLRIKKIANPKNTASSALVWLKKETLSHAATHFIQQFQEILSKNR